MLIQNGGAHIIVRDGKLIQRKYERITGSIVGIIYCVAKRLNKNHV